MSVALIIIGIVILVALYAWLRQRPAQSDTRPTSHVSDTSGSQFHAVSIKFEDSACNAAKKLEGKRFLSSAAPRFPLPDCDVLECKCRFIHHKDRRRAEDRRNPYRSTISGKSADYEKEKRIRGDRRGDDPTDFFS